MADNFDKIIRSQDSDLSADAGKAGQSETIAAVDKFNIGQLVELAPKILRPSAPGSYAIRYLVPDSGLKADPSYRIKSPTESYERVVPESELVLSHL